MTPGTPPATIDWKDSNGNVLADDGDGYVISQGSIDEKGTQSAELTINPTKIKALVDVVNTYYCNVTSGQYPDSPPSPDIKLLVTGLELGKFDM